MDYYRFNTESAAQSAMNKISTEGGLPLVGSNAKTREQCPNNAKTESWDTPRQGSDGKWYCKRLDSRILSTFGKEESVFTSQFTTTVVENPEFPE